MCSWCSYSFKLLFWFSSLSSAAIFVKSKSTWSIRSISVHYWDPTESKHRCYYFRRVWWPLHNTTISCGVLWPLLIVSISRRVQWPLLSISIPPKSLVTTTYHFHANIFRNQSLTFISMAYIKSSCNIRINDTTQHLRISSQIWVYRILLKYRYHIP